MIEILAQATTGPATPAGGGGAAQNFLNSPMPLLLIGFIVIYAMFLLPKRKQDKQRQQMLTQMKRGDEIQTIGGIIGKVVEARDDRVLVKVDESSNTKIWFTRGSIARVTDEDAKDAKAAATTK